MEVTERAFGPFPINIIMKKLVVFPLISADGWTFRASIADQERIMILAFGPKGEFMLRYYTDEDVARAWIDEVIAGKHVE